MGWEVSESVTSIIDDPNKPGRSELVIEDAEGRIIALCAGSPRCQDWQAVSRHASTMVEETRQCCNFTKKDKKHRRGTHPALTAGVSIGQGQPVSLSILEASFVFSYHHLATDAVEEQGSSCGGS